MESISYMEMRPSYASTLRSFDVEEVRTIRADYRTAQAFRMAATRLKRDEQITFTIHANDGNETVTITRVK